MRIPSLALNRYFALSIIILALLHSQQYNSLVQAHHSTFNNINSIICCGRSSQQLHHPPSMSSRPLSSSQTHTQSSPSLLSTCAFSSISPPRSPLRPASSKRRNSVASRSIERIPDAPFLMLADASQEEVVHASITSNTHQKATTATTQTTTNISSSSSSETKSTSMSTSFSATNSQKHNAESSRLLLNRRKLPKQLIKCRNDANKALNLLGKTYPHLIFSLEDVAAAASSMNKIDVRTDKDDTIILGNSNPIINDEEIIESARREQQCNDVVVSGDGGSQQQITWSYDQLVDILYGENNSTDHTSSITSNTEHDGDNSSNNNNNKDATNVGNSEKALLMIDGKSIVATMEVFRKARNVPAAMQLLKLSVDGVHHNRRQLRKKRSSNNGNNDDATTTCVGKREEMDNNELRQIYKATISLLGNVPIVAPKNNNSALTSTSSPRLLLHLLNHHMPHNGILPEAEIYHAVMNALGKSGACTDVLELLEKMECSYQSQLQITTSSVTSSSSSSSTVSSPPVDRMAYQTAIASLSKFGHCDTATQLLYRMRQKGFPPDISCYNSLLIGIAKEAGRGASGIHDGAGGATIVTMNENENKSAVESVNGADSTNKKSWHRVALQILHEMENDTNNGSYNVEPTEQSYNSIISACGKEGAWEEAARVSEKESKLRSRKNAMELGLCDEDFVDYTDKVGGDRKYAGGASSSSVGESSGDDSNLSMSKGGHSDKIGRSVQVSSDESLPNVQKPMATYFEYLDCYQKIGRGKDSWWEIGRYSIWASANTKSVTADADERNTRQTTDKRNIGENVNGETPKSHLSGRQLSRSIVVGLQPHRNPVRNGLSIVFYDGGSQDKLGRMLLKNVSSNRLGNVVHSEENSFETSDARVPQTQPRYYSSIVGMEVNKSRRGEGLSKLFVAIWLRICLETKAYPRAALMNKPLISLVLNQFGFVPQEGGVSVELVRLEKEGDDWQNNDSSDFAPHFGLYSPYTKSLQGIFSERTLRSQNIAILNKPPRPTSRQKATTIHIKTTFEHPISLAENAVVYKPPMSQDGGQKESVQVASTREASCDQNLFQNNHQCSLLSPKVERQKLDNQIHSILKTEGIGDDGINIGQLDFFSSIELLQGAFVSFAGNIR